MVYVVRMAGSAQATLPAHVVRSLPLTVLVLSGDSLTSVATFRRGGNPVDLRSAQAVTPPLHSMELAAIIPKALIRHALRVFDAGGALPPKTGAAVLAAVIRLRPALASSL